MDVSSVVTRVLVFVVAVVLMLSTIVSAQDEIVDMDHIKDPEFTLWQLPPEANVSREDEEAVLTVASEKPVGSFAVFAFKVQPNVRKVKIEAQVKVTDGRQGVNSWDKPRIHLTFHDGRGNQIGGWPDAGMWTGAKDWFSITKTFDLPAGATSVRVYGGLHDCSGAISFKNVKAYALDDKRQQVAPPPSTAANDTSKWYPWVSSSQTVAKLGSASTVATDVSWVLDKPAGKHGFVKTADGRLVFEDGTRARFIGVNVVAGACFPDKETAKGTATRLAAMGVNLVRLHHMDAAWAEINIFGNASSTLKLSPDSMDRLDYFIAQLKSRGIYVFMDLLVHRTFTEADGIETSLEAGAKVVGQFDDRLRQLQMGYAKQLLTHRNPYTKLRYVDEPAIALIDIINESSLFWSIELPKLYTDELTAKWNRWLTSRYGSREKLIQAWSANPSSSLALGEDPVVGTVLPAAVSGKDDSRRRDWLRFLYEKQNGYYLEMHKYLRSIGVRIPITGSNHWDRTALDVASNSRLDFVDQHGYWDHPQGGYGSEVTFNNNSMVTTLGGLVSSLMTKRVEGRPYTLTEWQNSWPNEYRAEGMLIVTAYSALQDVDALVQFDYTGYDWSPAIEGNFNVGNKPELMAQWPLVALAFHRGDILAGTGITAQLSEADMIRGASVDEVIAGYAALVDKTQLRFFTPTTKAISLSDVSDYVALSKTSPVAVKSKTGQLSWDSKLGLVTVDTPRTKGVSGFVGEVGSAVDLSGVSFDVKTPFACVTATSLDGEPLDKSQHILISAVARSENSGTSYNSARSRLLSSGSSPILMEPVEGHLTFNVSTASLGAKKAIVYTLDAYGRRSGKALCGYDNGSLKIALSSDDKTPWYEVVYE